MAGAEAAFGGLLSILFRGAGKAAARLEPMLAAAKANYKRAKATGESTAAFSEEVTDLTRKVEEAKGLQARTKAARKRERAALQKEAADARKKEAKARAKTKQETSRDKRGARSKKQTDAKKAKQKPTKSTTPKKESAPPTTAAPKNEQTAKTIKIQQVPASPSLTVPTGRIGGVPGGNRTVAHRNASEFNIESLEIENRSADRLAEQGYSVIQNPKDVGAIDEAELARRGLNPEKNPDYLIEGRIFDCLAPPGESARSVTRAIRGKIDDKQTRRVVVDLSRSGQPGNRVQVDDIINELRVNPIENLEELIFFDGDGKMQRYVP